MLLFFLLDKSGCIPSLSINQVKYSCSLILHVKQTESDGTPSMLAMVLLQTGSQTAQTYFKCSRHRVLYASKRACCGTYCSALL